MPVRSSRRPNRAAVLRLAGALFLGAFGLAACDDERSTVNDPDIAPAGPDAEIIFGSTVFAVGYYRIQNDVVEKALAYDQSGATLPVSFTASSGAGQLVLSRDGSNGRIRADFVNYQDQAVEPLFDLLIGQLEIEFDSAAPLAYTINPDDEPFLTFGPGPHAVFVSLIPEIGVGTIIFSGTVEGTLQNTDTAGLVGNLRQSGTIRLESTAERLLIVQRLATSYEYDGRVDGSFAPFPSGSFELAGFFAGVASSPIVVEFDGFGFTTFPYRGNVCQGNMTDPENGNSCSGL